MQKWEKLGVVISGTDPALGEASFASLPCGEFIDENLLKIYFSTRRKQNASFTQFAIVDISMDFKIIQWGREPVLSPGEPGLFDDAGAMACSIFKTDKMDFMFYVGWNLSSSVPFRNAIGLATREKGKPEFEKAYRGPLLDRSPVDPSFVASCDVVGINDELVMYYLSCDGWWQQDGELRHRYNIKVAKSTNCIDWHRDGTVAIDYKDENEYALATPRVLFSGNRWRMWFSYRGPRYRIGYAESSDGIVWKREDQEMIGFQADARFYEFDGEMQCYPFLFLHQGRIMMLYNGNGYGKSGIGAAVLHE
ncbi:MAG: hypothetical protein K2X77_15490 [Candidatus Obscuribacterales bacterium]|jgi:hypothetical protein|nr:hypothetical protein [Candidatus Obscuribacterales bacterium]